MQMQFRELECTPPRYWAGFAGLVALIAIGGLAALYMEHNGHYVTGMTNQIVWGTPHVFAVFLIVAASGALNVASLGSVFGGPVYKPLGPFSAVLSIGLLVGGLIILVLDLGRPDRLIVAMTTYNFKSIFAWNIYLYSGFIAIVGVYLWFMLDRKMKAYSRAAGFFAFFWRLALTTGTGSIFGFLVARQAYDAAIMAPMFIIMSFSYGLAFFIITLMSALAWGGREIGELRLGRLKNLLGIFVGAVAYFSLAYHLTNLYITEHHGVERFILLDGGVYTWLFWAGHILIGTVAPVVLLYLPSLAASRLAILAASFMVLLGGFAHIYLIIIGGQAYPLEMFPGKEILETGFFDGVVSPYVPSAPEVLLGIGGIALSMLFVAILCRMLRILPLSLADEVVASTSGGKAS